MSEIENTETEEVIDEPVAEEVTTTESEAEAAPVESTSEPEASPSRTASKGRSRNLSVNCGGSTYIPK